MADEKDAKDETDDRRQEEEAEGHPRSQEVGSCSRIVSLVLARRGSGEQDLGSRVAADDVATARASAAACRIPVRHHSPHLPAARRSRSSTATGEWRLSMNPGSAFGLFRQQSAREITALGSSRRSRSARSPA